MEVREEGERGGEREGEVDVSVTSRMRIFWGNGEYSERTEYSQIMKNIRNWKLAFQELIKFPLSLTSQVLLFLFQSLFLVHFPLDLNSFLIPISDTCTYESYRSHRKGKRCNFSSWKSKVSRKFWRKFWRKYFPLRWIHILKEWKFFPK